MPRGIYIRTKEHNKKISEAKKNKRTSLKTEFQKGHKDIVPATSRKIAGEKTSGTLIGHLVSSTTREKLRVAKLGKKSSEETRAKMSKALKGRKITWREKLSGPNNHNWKGTTPLKERIRKCFEYRQWRSDVFTRDNYTCVLCGVKGGYLEVDHYPKSFSFVYDENNILSFERAILCEEFWNINNGRTLCKKCHRKTDTYGKQSKK